MATFVLVHGMFHGGWCWDPLARALEARGHRVVAPDLAGCGGDATPPGDVTLAGWTEAIVGRVTAAGERVILVGHSRGGMVISEVAEAVPDDVAALVYIAAILLPDGASAAQIPAITAEAGHSVRPGDMTELNYTPDGKAARMGEAALERLYAPVDPVLRDWALPQVGIEPLAPLMTPLSLSDARYGRVPRIYVAARQDRLLPYESQLAMVARSQPVELHELDSGHQAILTHVDALAVLLDTLADRHASAGMDA